jgi:hypothetical protein
VLVGLDDGASDLPASFQDPKMFTTASPSGLVSVRPSGDVTDWYSARPGGTSTVKPRLPLWYCWARAPPAYAARSTSTSRARKPSMKPSILKLRFIAVEPLVVVVCRHQRVIVAARHNGSGGFPVPHATNFAAETGARFQLRTVFLMAVVVVLFVDAFFFSGAYTQAAYAQLVAAADFFVSLISGVIDSVKPEPDS